MAICKRAISTVTEDELRRLIALVRRDCTRCSRIEEATWVCEPHRELLRPKLIAWWIFLRRYHARWEPTAGPEEEE